MAIARYAVTVELDLELEVDTDESREEIEDRLNDGCDWLQAEILGLVDYNNALDMPNWTITLEWHEDDEDDDDA